MTDIALSIHKFEEGIDINEDSALCRDNLIAVSDGAGGGGLYADAWSRYLLDHLPEKPIISADALEEWIKSIWEPFYDDCERRASAQGDIFLDKFYDEGSFATLVAVWRTAPDEYLWLAYGDSVAFCYDRKSKRLEHSFSHLADFSKPPYLINCKDELRKEGFSCGRFQASPDTVVFCCSDALSHFVLMSYMLQHRERFADELQSLAASHSRNAILVRQALAMPSPLSFDEVMERLLIPLTASADPTDDFSALMKSLESQKLLGHDDYSLAMFASQPSGKTVTPQKLSRSDIRFLRKCLRRYKRAQAQLLLSCF